MVAVSALAGHLDMDCRLSRTGEDVLAYIFSQAAPILIWRAWGIRDTMGWRTQTIVCCVARYVVLSGIPCMLLTLLVFMQFRCSWLHHMCPPLQRSMSTFLPVNGKYRIQY